MGIRCGIAQVLGNEPFFFVKLIHYILTHFKMLFSWKIFGKDRAEFFFQEMLNFIQLRV